MNTRGFTGSAPSPARAGEAVRRLGEISRRAFTLIELMIVVAIIGMVAFIGVPAIYHAFHPESLQKAVSDVLEACGKARGQAIWKSAPVDLRWSPTKGQFQIVDAPQDAEPVDPSAPLAPGAASASTSNPIEKAEAKPEEGNSGQLSERVNIDMMDINFHECKDEDEVRVRFYPNGTCDEFTIVLRSLDTGESKKISLELVTGLADVTQFP